MRIDFLLVCTVVYLLSSVAQAQVSTVDQLKRFLAQSIEQREQLDAQPFAQAGLTAAEAESTAALLWADRQAQLKLERAAEMQAGEIVMADKKMPFVAKVFGEKPVGGRALVISMHGGGNAPTRVNDGQWKNQQRLYQLKEGVYVAPRAPTDTWNLWHEAHIDPMFDRLIENMIIFEDVDPNRVYLTGYSAGGDGTYQLAPRMADRFAAAAMMAGHPNEASPLGLRNLPFAIHVGELDSAYNRNKVAAEWGEKLKALQADDKDGYVHVAKLHTGRGHWMNGEDAEAIVWMTQFTRKPLPKKIVWRQDDVVGDRFYWLAIARESAQVGQEIFASVSGQRITITSADQLPLRVRVNDQLLNLDQPVEVVFNGQSHAITPIRTIAMQARSLQERADPTLIFSAEIALDP